MAGFFSRLRPAVDAGWFRGLPGVHLGLREAVAKRVTSGAQKKAIGVTGHRVIHLEHSATWDRLPMPALIDLPEAIPVRASVKIADLRDLLQLATGLKSEGLS